MTALKKPLVIFLSTAVGFALGYVLGSWLSNFLLSVVFADLPGQGRDRGAEMVLYVVLAFGMAILLAAIGFVAASDLIKRNGLFGLFPPEIGDGALDFSLFGNRPGKDGKPVWQCLFKGSMASDLLDQFLNGEGPRKLHIQKKSGEVMSLSFGEPGSFGKDCCTHRRPMLVTITRGTSVLLSLEAPGRGRYVAPEGQTYSWCTYDLAHLGCDKPIDARLSFQGPRDIMQAVFFNEG